MSYCLELLLGTIFLKFFWAHLMDNLNQYLFSPSERQGFKKY